MAHIIKIPKGCRGELYIHQLNPKDGTKDKSHWRENPSIVFDNLDEYGQDAVKIVVRRLH